MQDARAGKNGRKRGCGGLRRQDEDASGRGFLERFQKRVRSRLLHAIDAADDADPIEPVAGFVDAALDLAHVIDADRIRFHGRRFCAMLLRNIRGACNNVEVIAHLFDP